MTADDAPWFFGERGLDGWVQQPVPVGADCAGGCGQPITVTDGGMFLFNPARRTRHPIHWPCVHALIDGGAPRHTIE